MTTPTIPRQRERPRRLTALGKFVDQRVSDLQSAFLSQRGEATSATSSRGPRSRSHFLADPGATLAKLRRGVGKEVGELPELWQVTLEGLPEIGAQPGAGAQGKELPDWPTREERAVYTALTLYALHQQSQGSGMHLPGQGLGTAVALLARQVRAEVAVQRRFEALGTAESFPEAVHHARGLVTQLRGERIGLDYGLFADQLHWLQTAGGATRVRLAWGRDYYRTLHEKPEQQNSAEKPATDPGENA